MRVSLSTAFKALDRAECLRQMMVGIIEAGQLYQLVNMQRVNIRCGPSLLTRVLDGHLKWGSFEFQNLRAKKPFLTLNLRTNGLRSLPNHYQRLGRRAVCRTESFSGHSSKQQPRSKLLDSVISR
ncbi:hypothetical protein J6590_015403 [Homalodisca vitripennis]|nr:hypothetical protein J6590_015403 [Homalodisca vitripennis]